METLSGNEEETEPEKQRDSSCSFCHGVRELQGRSYPYSLLHSWFHH
ncbi:unnamed protein product [Brassica oleracea var. botrytis]